MLTLRETEVMRLVCDGEPDKAIAAMLRIRESTVGAHLRSVFRKLGVHSRAHAVAVYLRADYDERSTTNVQFRQSRQRANLAT